MSEAMPTNKSTNKSTIKPAQKSKRSCQNQRQGKGDMPYADVTEALGNCRFKERLWDNGAGFDWSLKGSFPKSKRVATDDVRLVQDRQYESETSLYFRKGKVILKNSFKEPRKLKKMWKLPHLSDSEDD
jgi:hypothetical protein